MRAKRKTDAPVGGVAGLLDSRQAAEWLTVSPRALTTLCLGDKRKGLAPRLAFVKRPREKKRLFDPSELQRFVDAHRIAAFGPAGVRRKAWREDDKFTADQAAAFVGLSVRTLNRMCAEREVTYYKPVRERRFLRSDLEAWLEGA